MKPFFYLLLIAGLSVPTQRGAASSDPAFPGPHLDLLFSGTHLAIYTSGIRLSAGRNKKSGVWNVPSRKVAEMWVQRRGETEWIRLDPHRYQRQLVSLLHDFPEVHNYIEDPRFLYKNLATEIEVLDGHLDKILEVRREKRKIRADQELIIGK